MSIGPTLILVLGLLGAPIPPPVAAPAEAAQFPYAEDVELLTLATLAPAAMRTDLMRYTLRRGFGYGTKPSAQIVEAHWPIGPGYPRVTLVEFTNEERVWRVVERREALVHPIHFEQLVRNVTAAATAIGARADRGTVVVCSHSDSSRLDLRLSDQGSLPLTRTAHCSDDAPAVVAGQLLAAAVNYNLRLNWTPER